MNSYTFETIKKEVLQWCQNHISKGAEYMQLTKNETEIIIIDLTFAHCLAQITINTPIFAPYKYVFFEAGTIESQKAEESGKPEWIYFFSDTEDMTVKEVIDALETAVEYCLKYTPDTKEEDDEVQFYDPTYAGGANKLCLKEAQEKYRLDVNKKFVASLHKTVIEEGKILYKTLYETLEITKRTTDYWKETIAFYQSLDVNQRSVLLNIVEQTMVDTISSVLGVLDGAGTLSGENFEFDIKINGVSTEDELQDIFLAYVEERK